MQSRMTWEEITNERFSTLYCLVGKSMAMVLSSLMWEDSAKLEAQFP